MKHYGEQLYLEFKARVLESLEADGFYEYFIKAIGSGVRFYGQKNERLIKKVDEKWVDALYDTIPALDEIVNKPRRFIEREEIIVPVELARKVGADSVKHLSTHTQLISRVDDAGNVVPNRIMNIYNEESYNLYENRFIITLIQRACSFIDQRYDSIMDALGEEFQSALRVDSSFCDNDESVEYNLNLKLHQGREYLGSKDDNTGVKEKIEHIRLMYTSFKRTEFYQSLAGCTLVKSPISRTNLIVKNPYFQQCYSLWTFLERYTEPGFSIEKLTSDGDFDPEYVAELNAMILFSYLIMKNNLENTHNKPIDISNAKLRVIRPRFNSNIVGETTPDYDIQRAELKQSPGLSASQNAASLLSQEDIIVAVLAKALREEQIISALEKALDNAFCEYEIKKEARAQKEETVRQLLGKFIEEEKKRGQRDA